MLNKKPILFTVFIFCLSLFVKAQNNHKLTNACGASANFIATTPICYPNCVVFTDMSTTSQGFIALWSWNFGDSSASIIDNPSHCYKSEGIYIATLVITTSLGCVDSVSDTIIVYPQPLVGITFYPKPPPFPNPILTFTDTVKDSLINLWQWNFGDDSFAYYADTSGYGPLVHSYDPGEYIVCLTVTDIHGCTSMTCDTVIVSPIHLGINNITDLRKVWVFPNPNNGNFILSLSNVNQKCTIEIYNYLGEKILTETLPSMRGDNLINLTGQPDGVYLYRVLNEKGELVGEGKIIIQK